MIRFNEERIGRMHVFFEVDDVGGDDYSAPLAPNEHTNSEFRTPENNWGNGRNKSGGSGGGVTAGSTTSAPTTASGVSSGGSSTTASVNSEAAARAAMEAAAKANAARAQQQNTGINAIKGRMNVNTRTGPTVVTTRDAVTNAINNIRGEGSIQSQLNSKMTMARETGLDLAQSALERGESEESAINAYINAVTNDYATQMGTSFTSIAGDQYKGDINAIREAFRAGEAAKAARARTTAAVTTITSEETAEVEGAKVAEEIATAASNDTTGSFITKASAGTARGILEALSNNQISAPNARSFMRSFDGKLAQLGHISYYGNEKAQRNVSEQAKEMFQIGADVRGLDYTMSLGKDQAESAQYNGANNFATDTGMTEAETKNLMDGLVAFNDENSRVEDRTEAYVKVMEAIADKIDPADQQSLADATEILIGLEVKQAEHVDSMQNEGALAKQAIQAAKEGLKDGSITQDIFDEFEQQYNIDKKEAKAEIALFNKIKFDLHRVEELLSKRGTVLIPPELWALQFVTEARVRAYEYNYRMGAFLLKLVGGFICMPFSPIFGVKTIIAAFKGLNFTEGLSFIYTDPNMDLVDYHNDPTIAKWTAEIVAENSGLYNAGKNLKNKGIKAVILGVLSLFCGNVAMFAMYAATALIAMARYCYAYQHIRAYLPNTNEIYDAAYIAEQVAENSDSGEVPTGLNYLEEFEEPTQGYIGESIRRIDDGIVETEEMEGGNAAQSDVSGYNAGIGSEDEAAEIERKKKEEEEYYNYIRENVNNDAALRRVVDAL